MPTIFRTSLVLAFALSITLLAACGGEAEDSPAAGASASDGCTERDGAWFGRRSDGTGIISQTQEECEKRLDE